MASNWNYKSSLKEEHTGVDDMPEVSGAEVSEKLQMTNKNTVQKIKDWFSLVDIKKVFGTVLKSFAFIIPVIATVFLMGEVQKGQSLGTEASAYQAQLLFQANQIVLPPNTDIKVLLNTDGPVGFMRAEISFDPSLVKLTKDADLAISPLKKVISVTPFSEANTTGRLIIVLAHDPSGLTAAPTGNFEVAGLSFSANTTASNLATVVSFDTTKSEVVHSDKTLFNVSSINLSVSLNPVATIAPTPTATPVVVVPTPTATSVSVSTPTATPVVKSCGYCSRNRCDGRCDPRKETSRCADCI